MAERLQKEREAQGAVGAAATGRDSRIPRWLTGQEDYDKQLAEILTWTREQVIEDRALTRVEGVDPYVP